ncbi:MAG: hypothetical protein ACI8W8_000632 [Rhodothermales bacterium]|jgi:hypothetical protein
MTHSHIAYRHWGIAVTTMALLLLAATSVTAGERIIKPSAKHAWSETAGWQNWRDANGSVTVVLDGANGYLKGYAWAERVGWIKLGVGAGSGPYASTNQTNWGVNMDAAGNLSGYAWSETCGWLNFNPSHSQVIVDLTSGEFDGYAWGERLGWVHFKNASPAYNVAIDARGTVLRIR